MWEFQIFPEQASTVAGDVDGIYFALVAVTAFFAIAIYLMILFFSVKYRRGREADRSNPPSSNHKLEAVWIIIPLGIALAIFGWSTKVFFDMQRPPQDALEIQAIGKQWMWKFQNPDGRREVNELHIPTGRPVKITMISQDVIHDLFVPAFRVKADVLPGRYTYLWFEATKPGTYHLFCAEYCGLQHSGMIGKVVVMEPQDYENWLNGGTTDEIPAVAGEKVFNQLGCNTCHSEESGARGPSLVNLFDSEVTLRDGNTVLADENYIRHSIMNPASQVVAGFDAIMPTYKNQISEEQIFQIVSYLKTLGATETTTEQN